jgi:hypothetical protein
LSQHSVSVPHGRSRPAQWPTRVRTLTAADPNRRATETEYDNPVHGVVCHRVYWLTDAVAADRVFKRTKGILADYQAGLQHSWHNLPPDKVAGVIEWAATVEAVALWDDEAIAQRVPEVVGDLHDAQAEPAEEEQSVEFVRDGTRVLPAHDHADLALGHCLVIHAEI